MARAIDPELLAEARRIQVRADRMVTDVMAVVHAASEK